MGLSSTPCLPRHNSAPAASAGTVGGIAKSQDTCLARLTPRLSTDNNLLTVLRVLTALKHAFKVDLCMELTLHKCKVLIPGLSQDAANHAIRSVIFAHPELNSLRDMLAQTTARRMLVNATDCPPPASKGAGRENADFRTPVNMNAEGNRSRYPSL